MRAVFDFTAHAEAPRLELCLRTAEGEDWILTFASGMERFIGAYPRVSGFESRGPLLSFRVADSAR
jgi:hypothetical protein